MSTRKRARLILRGSKRFADMADRKSQGESKYKDLIAGTMLTVFLGGFLGEFVIKRNIEIYNNSRKIFKESVVKAKIKFNSILKDYNQVIRSRRGVTTVMREYVNNADIENLDRNFQNYEKIVDYWNSEYQNMANKIVNITNCKNLDEEEVGNVKLYMKYKILGENTNHNSKFLIASNIRENVSKEFAKAKYPCPTYFITMHDMGDFHYSVHDILRKMHKNIFKFRNNSYFKCKIRHIKNLDAYYRSCAAQYREDEVNNCISRFSRIVEAGGFCRLQAEEFSDYAIPEVEFQKLDFYWDMGNKLTEYYRRSFYLDECLTTIGFWGSILNWNCKKLVDSWLDKE